MNGLLGLRRHRRKIESIFSSPFRGEKTDYIRLGRSSELHETTKITQKSVVEIKLIALTEYLKINKNELDLGDERQNCSKF